MTSDSIQQARETIDRLLNNCENIDVGNATRPPAFQDRVSEYLLELTRFAECVEASPLLQRCAQDAVDEWRRLLDRLDDSDREVRAALVVLRQKAQVRFPVLAENADNAQQGQAFYTGTLAFFDQTAAGQEPCVRSVDRFADVSGTGLMVEALWTALAEFLPSKGIAADDIGAEELKRDLRDLRRRRREIHQETLNLQRNHAGSVWLRLRTVVDELNPAWDSMDAYAIDWGGDSLSHTDAGHIRRLLYGRGSVENSDKAWFADYQAGRSHELRIIGLDFQVRLGLRASVTWILHRYAQRCRRLRLGEIHALLNEHAALRQKERLLARDAAVFLFDQGFEVITEQSMGSHRYDIIGEPLLVEAKTYDGSRRGLVAVVDGLAQIHQYANTLADEGVQVDPVLLVFRLGGPRATPVSEYKIGNLRVTIAHVDLGTSADSGSNSPPPEPDITEAIITAKLVRKTSAPRGRTKKRRRGG
jgi:predicted secreted protein